MLRRSLRLFMLMTALVSLVGVFGTPITAEAASGIGKGQCIKQKPTDCQQKGGSGSGQPPATTTTPAQGAACQGFQEVDSGVPCSEADSGNSGQTTIGSTVSTVVGFLSIVAGIVGIIFILLSGFRYITSGGDQNKVASAKTTLIYALAGLAVAGAAQILIHAVLSTANGV